MVARSEAAEAKLRELFAHASAEAGPTRFRAVVEAMFRAYRGDVQSFVRKRLPESRVDDACGATWDALPQALDGFKGESSFHTWLLRIARNKAADEFRRGKDNRYEALSNVISKLCAQAPSRERPSRVVASVEMNRLVREFIDQLEPDDRELFLLRYEDGQSGADIARARGLPPNTISQRLARMRNRVKKLLQAAGVG